MSAAVQHATKSATHSQSQPNKCVLPSSTLIPKPSSSSSSSRHPSLLSASLASAQANATVALDTVRQLSLVLTEGRHAVMMVLGAELAYLLYRWFDLHLVTCLLTGSYPRVVHNRKSSITTAIMQRLRVPR